MDTNQNVPTGDKISYSKCKGKVQLETWGESNTDRTKGVKNFVGQTSGW